MLRDRTADAKATMSLKDRMKFFEAAAAAEAEKKKAPPRISTPARRNVTSSGSFSGPSPSTTADKTPRRGAAATDKTRRGVVSPSTTRRGVVSPSTTRRGAASPSTTRRGAPSLSTTATKTPPLVGTSPAATTAATPPRRNPSSPSTPRRNPASPATPRRNVASPTNNTAATPPRGGTTPGCMRVSLSRTISGESVLQEVVSPISLPTRTRIGEHELIPDPAKDNTVTKINKCQFSEVRRDNAEVLERSSDIQPVENRVDGKVDDKVDEIGEKADTDRDSGVSCSSDDQDTLSDSEVVELRGADRDSGVFAAKSDKMERVIIDTAITAVVVESPDDTVTESDGSVTSLDASNVTSPVSVERAQTPVKKAWQELLTDDQKEKKEDVEEKKEEVEEKKEEVEEKNEEVEEKKEDKENECSELSNKDQEESKTGSGDDEKTLVDTSLTEEEKAPFHSPFEGTINLSMSAKEAISSQPPSHKGFLTIFQDESGLGAWNRRWCSVQDNKIYYWLYPEDEVNQNKQPHGEIDLRNCKTETVSIASRLDCARPNTFVLVIMVAAQPGDRASIITESNGKTTQTKYMLSADSREERKQWMEVLNKCLQSVHSWNH